MTKQKKNTEESNTQTNKIDINSLEWNDHVLGLLSDDEKIDGNPTTDGLRRIFEIALNCTIIAAESVVVQSPTPENEKRATVTHTLTYVLNDSDVDQQIKMKTATGAADVYWGNCDKIYRNHPVAVAETRAEGRALRRALRLRKVVAAEELAKNIEDDVNSDSANKISEQQINFMDVLAKRSNINMKELLLAHSIDSSTIKSTSHDTAVSIIRELSKYQQNLDSIPVQFIGYDNEWRL